MARRRDARRLALEILFEADVARTDADELLERRGPECGGEAPFVADLVNGVVKNQEAIDSIISRYAHEWRIDRMPTIDRNIVRMGIYELVIRPGASLGVVINEAVELAKRYSTEDSGRFVNGVLARVAENEPGALSGIDLTT